MEEGSWCGSQTQGGKAAGWWEGCFRERVGEPPDAGEAQSAIE